MPSRYCELKYILCRGQPCQLSLKGAFFSTVEKRIGKYLLLRIYASTYNYSLLNAFNAVFESQLKSFGIFSINESLQTYFYIQNEGL